MDFAKLNHIAIISTDYRASIKFYVDGLGFELVNQFKRDDKNDILVNLRQGLVNLELFIKKDAPKRINFPEAAGLRHISFEVTDINNEVSRLLVKGIECEPIRTDEFTGEKMTFCFDPDGLPIELHE